MADVSSIAGGASWKWTGDKTYVDALTIETAELLNSILSSLLRIPPLTSNRLHRGTGDENNTCVPLPSSSRTPARVTTGTAFDSPLNTTSDPVSVTAARNGSQYPARSGDGKKEQLARPAPPTDMKRPGLRTDGGCWE